MVEGKTKFISTTSSLSVWTLFLYVDQFIPFDEKIKSFHIFVDAI